VDQKSIAIDGKGTGRSQSFQPHAGKSGKKGTQKFLNGLDRTASVNANTVHFWKYRGWKRQLPLSFFSGIFKS
jgi:hypothetical protein